MLPMFISFLFGFAIGGWIGFVLGAAIVEERHARRPPPRADEAPAP